MHINYFEGGEYEHGHVILHGVPGGGVGVPGWDSPVLGPLEAASDSVLTDTNLWISQL